MARSALHRSPLAAPTAPWSWAAWGLALGMALACVVFAPAQWVQRAANTASDGLVLLEDSQGTLWQGSARFALSGGVGSHDLVRLPGRVQWELRPGLGAVYLRLNADCCIAPAQALALELRPGWGQWSVQLLPGESHWPAEILAGLGTPWNTVQLHGNLRLSTPGLRVASALQRVQLDGTLTLDAPQLSSRLSTLHPLGSYRLQVHGGETPRLELQTLQGSLQLRGQGQWTSGRLHFEGAANADETHEAELSNLLNILGRRDGARSVITLG